MLKALKEALSALSKPVTITYPAGGPEEKYSQVPKGLRGKPQFDDEKCIGCGACTVQCSSGADTYHDEGELRILEVKLSKCIFCGRCQEICPEDAIKLTTDFELANNVKGQLIVRLELPLFKCENCGTPITTERQLNKIEERILTQINAQIKDIAKEDLSKYLHLCKNCRRKLSYKLNIHTRKHYLY
ncbi:MAG: 4Fe-4S dicluster domain-containing protein [archaeon GB-1867-035]|nr:4Fe-4S dicluster domain-containing protein [Candidatus Culexmicrobium profundum]